MVLHRGQAAEAFWTKNRFKIGEEIVGLAAQTGQRKIVTDLTEEGRYLRPSVIKAGFRQIAYFPLKSGENLMGVMSVATRSSEPLEEQGLKFLDGVANWAGLAIENASLHQNARRLAVLEERSHRHGLA